MLRIIQTKEAGAAKGYYTSASEYYGSEQEQIGEWGGEGAALLGLSGPIERFHFDRLCDNRHPDSGERLTARMRQGRRVGYDFNFHACKSASLLHAVTDDPAILAAFRRAVGTVMRKMEREATVRVRKRGRFAERASGNLIWAEYVHFTARPVSGVIDPHLHSHCFVMNASFDPVERIWKAADVASLKANAPRYEAMFHREFGSGLEAIGYPVVWRGERFEIAGITRETIARFSARTRQIDQVAAKRGITDPVAKDQLGARTRERKDRRATWDQLRRGWRERLTSYDHAAILAAGTRRRVIATAPNGQAVPYGGLSRDAYRQLTGRSAGGALPSASLPPGLYQRQRSRTNLAYQEPEEVPPSVASGSPTPHWPGHGR